MENLRAKILLSQYRTQELFAERVGISESLISKYCRGLRPISKKHLPIIKKALKIK